MRLMPRRKKPPMILEADGTVGTSAAPLPGGVPTVDGSIGVEYTPPPPPDAEPSRYICANCKGGIVLRAHSCPTCESEIDWSSLNDT